MTEAFVHPNLEKIPNPPPSRLEGSGGGGGGRGGLALIYLEREKPGNKKDFEERKKEEKNKGETHPSLGTPSNPNP